MPRISQIRCPRDIALFNWGIERKEIFIHDTDRSDFIDRLAALVDEGAVKRELGYSCADVARYLGVTNSCVPRFVASGKKSDADDLIKKFWTFCTNVPTPRESYQIHDGRNQSFGLRCKELYVVWPSCT